MNPDKPPPKRWLGPPSSEGLKPLMVAKGSRKGKWKWEEIPQRRSDREMREEWERRMAKADKKDIARFNWPPNKED